MNQRKAAKHATPTPLPIRVAINGHKSTCQNWSPNGQLLAFSSFGTLNFVRGASTSKLAIRHAPEINEHFNSDVTSLSFAPDSRSIAVGHLNGTLSLIRLPSRSTNSNHFNYQSLDVSNGCVLSLLWLNATENSRLPLLAIGTSAGTVRLIKVAGEADVSSTLTFSGPTVDYLFSPDPYRIVAASRSGHLRVWNVQAPGRADRINLPFEKIRSFAWDPVSMRLFVGLDDATLGAFDWSTRQISHILEGHTGAIDSIAIHSNGEYLASSSSEDQTVRVWQLGPHSREIHAFEELPASSTHSVAFSPGSDTLSVLSGEKLFFDDDERPQAGGTSSRKRKPKVRTNVAVILLRPSLKDLTATAPLRPISYKKAKVVLVGNSGVGKTALGMILDNQQFVATESTHRRNIWCIHESEAIGEDNTRETRQILLWDLAGQAGYRVFHQLHLNDTAVALLLFDSKHEADPFSGISYWSQALDQANSSSLNCVKCLVASRIDRFGPTVSKQRISATMDRYAIGGYFAVSAKRGDGILELKTFISQAISWNLVPAITAPQLFHDVKRFVLTTKEAGETVVAVSVLWDLFLKSGVLTAGADNQSHAVFRACLGQLETAGYVKLLAHGEWVLLQPELLDDYVAWIAQAAQAEPDGLGYISERSVVGGNLPMDPDRALARRTADEHLLLRIAVEEVITRGVGFREATDGGEMLVFPSEMRTDFAAYPEDYSPVMAFEFRGPVRAAYATLCVKLVLSSAFGKGTLFRDAAVFATVNGSACGMALSYPDKSDEGFGCLTAFFSGGCQRDTQLLLLRYIRKQLLRLAYQESVASRRIYTCACEYVLPPDAVARRVARSETDVICPDCGARTLIDNLADQVESSDSGVQSLDNRVESERAKQARAASLETRRRLRAFDVFISYASADRQEARELSQRLVAEGLLVWVDYEQVKPGDAFVEVLEEVLERVPSVLFACGKNGIGKWQAQEYYVTLRRVVDVNRRKSGRKPPSLIPVLLPSMDATEVSDHVIPSFLQSFSYVDFRGKSGFENPSEMERLVESLSSGNEAD